MGFYVVVLNPNGNATDRRIIDWTRQYDVNPGDRNDPDSVVAVDFNVGGYVRFSNSLFASQVFAADQPATKIQYAWDPPGDPRPQPGPSQHTTFDNRPLSSRDEVYQKTAVNWFADFVLSGYLQSRTYIIEPTPEVLAIFNGRFPQTSADVVELLNARPELLDKIRCLEPTFVPQQLSPAARQICLNLLDSATQLERYLENPQEFVREYSDSTLHEVEAAAFVRAANEKRDLVVKAFDCVELGRAKGDSNTYILIGLDNERRLPNRRGLEWFAAQLELFVAANGFIPGFGWYVTEARMRYRVILGPGVTDREKTFLAFFGHEVIDRRQADDIGLLV